MNKLYTNKFLDDIAGSCLSVVDAFTLNLS